MPQADVAEMANTKWNEAFNKKDSAALAKLYTSTAKLLPPANLVVSGTAEIQKFWQGLFDAGFTDHTIRIVDVRAAEDLTCQGSQWTASGPGPTGTRQTFRGSLVSILEKQGDGSWKLQLHSWNIASD